MKRWAFNIAAAVSGVAMIVVIVTGVLSYWYVLHAAVEDHSTFQIAFAHGLIGVIFDDVGLRGDQRYYAGAKTHDISYSLNRLASFQLTYFSYVRRSSFVVITFPVWYAIAVSALLPTIWFTKWRHRRSLPKHPCAKCEYDLQGTLAAGRTECPECGAKVDEQAMSRLSPLLLEPRTNADWRRLFMRTICYSSCPCVAALLVTLAHPMPWPQRVFILVVLWAIIPALVGWAWWSWHRKHG